MRGYILPVVVEVVSGVLLEGMCERVYILPVVMVVLVVVYKGVIAARAVTTGL